MKRLALLALVLLGGCSGIQTSLDPAGDQARHIDLIWRTMLGVCGFMYVLVLGFLAWALWRTRRASRLSPPATGHTIAERGLERSLTGWTALIVVGLIGLSTVSFLVDRSLAAAGPQPLNIKITANQWWWDIKYEGVDPSQQISTANELHLPINRAAHIELQAGDVIHSFWVPNLSGKEDLIPGKTNTITLTPRRLGLFRGQCAEFCGLQHAHMALDVVVQSPGDFAAWRAQQLAEAPPPSTEAQQRGQQLFLSKACVMCHAVQGTTAGGVTGPDLTHVASRRSLAAGTLPNNAGGMAAWIADPQGRKPGTMMPRVTVSSDELNDLVAYMQALR